MDIDIVMVTWPNHPKRLEYFCDGVGKLKEMLSASRHKLRWWCSSESQRATDAKWCGKEVTEICRKQGIELHWREGKAGLGENMNAALRLGSAPFILLVQDDQHIKEPLDLSPGIEFLNDNPGVDLLRYSWPADHMVKWADSPDTWPRFDVIDGWCYGDDPHLRRRSFMDKWGWYLEDTNWQGASEGHMLRRLREGNAQIAAADRRYFANMGRTSCDLNNKRWSSNR